jgi:hypothetical protein
MQGKSHFRYKKGRKEIESDNDIGAAIRLARLNTILYWLWRFLIIGIALYKYLSG